MNFLIVAVLLPALACANPLYNYAPSPYVYDSEGVSSVDPAWNPAIKTTIEPEFVNDHFLRRRFGRPSLGGIGSLVSAGADLYNAIANRPKMIVPLDVEDKPEFVLVDDSTMPYSADDHFLRRRRFGRPSLSGIGSLVSAGADVYNAIANRPTRMIVPVDPDFKSDLVLVDDSTLPYSPDEHFLRRRFGRPSLGGIGSLVSAGADLYNAIANRPKTIPIFNKPEFLAYDDVHFTRKL